MTRQKSFKTRVRTRMAKTGESYTAARRMLLPADGSPAVATPAFEPVVPEATASEATGRGYDAWFKLIDAWGGTERSHTEIARWLMDEHQVAGWWAQSLTVSYERARGLRAVGQTSSGFTANATKTCAVPVETLYNAVIDDALRERWLRGAQLHLRTATAPKSARYDWEDGSSRVVISCEALGDRKSRIAVMHERLTDAEGVAEMKAYWRDHLSALKALVEKEA